MHETIALLIAIFSPIIGIITILRVKPIIKERTTKKLLLHLCNFICAIGFVIYISFIICSRNEHINQEFTYTEYSIERLTFHDIYFENKRYNLHESNFIIEEPNDRYNNVVVVEKENFIMQWFCKVRRTYTRYHVYLSEEVYDRFQDGNVIYEIE